MLVALARVQRDEVGNAAWTEHDRLTVDHEMLLAQLRRGLDDRGKYRDKS